jgi:hypothetical protein
VTDPDSDDADLTPQERALLKARPSFRGRRPIDDTPEPEVGPSEPVGIAHPRQPDPPATND